MLVVRATKKLLDRLGPVTQQPGQASTTRLGDWYATAWAFWNWLNAGLKRRSNAPVRSPT